MNMDEFNNACVKINDAIFKASLRGATDGDIGDLYVKAALHNLAVVGFDVADKATIPQPICKIIAVGGRYTYLVPVDQI